MRLIDADEMLKRNKHSVYDTTDLEEMLDNEPTAYDIGKVVEDVRRRCYEMGLDESQTEIIVNEIVKQGGVADDVCEWKKRVKTYDWEPSCEPNSTYNVAGVGWFKYCPYCGKKIKVVE